MLARILSSSALALAATSTAEATVVVVGVVLAAVVTVTVAVVDAVDPLAVAAADFVTTRKIKKSNDYRLCQRNTKLLNHVSRVNLMERWQHC